MDKGQTIMYYVSPLYSTLRLNISVWEQKFGGRIHLSLKL